LDWHDSAVHDAPGAVGSAAAAGAGAGGAAPASSGDVKVAKGDTKAVEGKGIASAMRVICTPCQHFSGRYVLDQNETLWASWVIKGLGSSFYFAGDTGYRSIPQSLGMHPSPEEERKLDLPVCPAFKEIGDRYGPFDLAAIPIGAYSPRWVMSPVHLSPEDAVCVHQDIKSRQSVGMHWGTFALTDEPLWEPPERLAAELTFKNLSPTEFIALQHGETRMFPGGKLSSAGPAIESSPVERKEAIA